MISEKSFGRVDFAFLFKMSSLLLTQLKIFGTSRLMDTTQKHQSFILFGALADFVLYPLGVRLAASVYALLSNSL